jgi:hypothetical protein
MDFATGKPQNPFPSGIPEMSSRFPEAALQITRLQRIDFYAQTAK